MKCALSGDEQNFEWKRAAPLKSIPKIPMFLFYEKLQQSLCLCTHTLTEREKERENTKQKHKQTTNKIFLYLLSSVLQLFRPSTNKRPKPFSWFVIMFVLLTMRLRLSLHPPVTSHSIKLPIPQLVLCINTSTIPLFK